MSPDGGSRAALTTCVRCQSPLEAGDLRCAVCALATEESSAAADAQAMGGVATTRAKILRCDECMAALSFSIEARAPRCAFCGSVMHIEQPVDPLETAEWILPFTVEREGAQAALHGWLRRLGRFRPSDLASAAVVDSLRPLHWAAWIFDARALVSWTADSDLDSHSSYWAPYAGQVSLDWRDILVPASRGLSWKECARLTPHFSLGSAQPAAAAAAATDLEQFDTQRSAARRTIMEAIEATAAAQLQQGTIPGSKFRNVNVGVLLESLHTRRVALPTWVLAYRYRGRVYRALVHGQDDRLTMGAAPYSLGKIALAILGGAVGLALLAWIVAMMVGQ